MKNKFLTQLKKPLIWLFWLLVWQGVYLAVGSDVIVASPLMTARRVVQLSATPAFWRCCANSVGHILAGFVLAFITAVVLALLAAHVPFFDALFSPILRLVRATPVASFIVLALLWLRGSVSVFIAFLMVLPLMFGNLSEGFRSIDTALLEMAAVYHLSFAKRLRLIYLPSLMPYLVSACSTGLGFAFKAGIAAEVIGLPKNSLGNEIYNAKIYIETVDLFALTAVIIILSLVMEKLMMALLRAAQKWILKGGDGAC